MVIRYIHCIVSYKGHTQPVWDVKFSPLGHYFVTASHDQTARLWATDHIYPLRIFAGHINDVDCVEFHPNSNYVLLAQVIRLVVCGMYILVIVYVYSWVIPIL